MTPEEVYELVEAKLPDQVWEVAIVAGEGLRLLPRWDMSNEQLEQLLLPHLASVNWIVTSLKNGVLVEPRYTSELTVAQGTEFYHVAYRVHRDNIEAEGLKLSTGGNTRMARKYPPRIFLALGFDAANKFIEFQARNTKPALREGKFVRADPIKTREDFDIWRVKTGEGLKLYRDILFPGEAGWTETAFPRDHIERV